jgi:hypothetical protein
MSRLFPTKPDQNEIIVTTTNEVTRKLVNAEDKGITRFTHDGYDVAVWNILLNDECINVLIKGMPPIFIKPDKLLYFANFKYR